ncbi:MAG TPA: Lpg1974 family pore-forming outer membrane protein [Chlamydiales bacterium]|nr:Lpg1974 family pore-forming outer membrane protein [Chlamydiales bacterium]
MNLLAKTGSWIVALLVIAATPVFGQNGKAVADCGNRCVPQMCCPPKPCCEEMPKLQLPCAYNAPARIEVKCPWDLYVSASFTYWQPIQNNMEIGVIATASGLAIDGHVKNFNADFEPGFKVGIGMNFDHDSWDSQIVYTWFRGNTSESVKADDHSSILPLWSVPSSDDAFGSASERWKLHMDLLDWELGRSYYVGRQLTFRPFIAVRGAWIRQSVNVDYDVPVVAAAGDLDVHKKSHSWAVGPRMGLATNWIFCDDFRIFGNGAADILFTRYTSLRSTDERGGLFPATFAVRQHDYNAIRPHMELELGFGWGTYLDCYNWYLDFSAGYSFQVFFDQNMFRHFNDALVVNSVSPNGNLYMQGLTLTVRVDF